MSGKVHLIGIGGIGVSAIAQYYLENGAEVSGSDLVSSEITDLLEKKGAKLSLGSHKSGNLIDGADLVIYSPAVKEDNPEFKKAKESGLKLLSYPEALGELTKKYFTIAVSGAHGKSTTTSMIAKIMIEAGLDPTVIVGTKLKEFGGSNFRPGKSRYLLIEADEWSASFLNYWPKIIVLTNIEREHLDYYKNLPNILKTFKEYVGHLPEDGALVANEDDENINKIFNFSARGGSALGGQIPISNQFSILKFSKKQREAKDIKKILKVPGEHNVSNALAALSVARLLEVSDRTSFKALSEYKGVWRRFEVFPAALKGKRITVVSDYGHHPTEIGVTLKAAREKFPEKEIWCVFQPHQYQRTFYLFDDFVKVFKEAADGKLADKIIITDVYDVAGREDEKIKKKVNSEKLVEKIGKPEVAYLPREKIKPCLSKNIKSGEVVIIMGAGDIYELTKELLKQKK